LTVPPQAFSLSARPAARMFLAALTSRSWTVPHSLHVHDRTCKGLGPSRAPHAEHTWEVGANRLIRANVRPYMAALYSSIATNWLHPASCTLLASFVRARLFTARFSTYTAWFSRINAVDSLCVKSRRASATRACALATLSLARSEERRVGNECRPRSPPCSGH